MVSNTRYFLAIEIPTALKKKIQELIEDLPKQGLKFVSVENIHITLKFIGHLSAENIHTLITALENVSFSRFSIELSGVDAFSRHKRLQVIWICCQSTGLDKLAGKIHQITGEKKHEKFIGHLTIARVKKQPPQLPEFLKKNKERKLGSFQCEGFVLKQSFLKRTGSVYTTVHTFLAK